MNANNGKQVVVGRRRFSCFNLAYYENEVFQFLLANISAFFRNR